MYLTRAEAVAKLGGDEDSANAVLNWSLRIYPRSHRTNFELITGYRAGSIGRYPDGMNTTELFTVSNW
jgi:hypothetical protein